MVEIEVWDWDRFTADDRIGSAKVSLGTLMTAIPINLTPMSNGQIVVKSAKFVSTAVPVSTPVVVATAASAVPVEAVQPPCPETKVRDGPCTRYLLNLPCRTLVRWMGGRAGGVQGWMGNA